MNTTNIQIILSLLSVSMFSCQSPKGAANSIPIDATAITAAAGAVQTSACVSDAKPEFTSQVVDPQYVRSVSPLPALATGVAFEGRSYITIADAYDGVQIPVYAPVNMTLVAAKNYIPEGAPAGYQADWALAFEVSCEVSIGFAHIKLVSPKIAQVNVAPLSGSSAPVQTSSKVAFVAGEIIGYYIKGLSSIAFDFIITNQNVTNRFANQARYEVSNHKLLHVICPWDLFTPALKKSYYDLLAGPGGIPNPTLNIGCGNIEQDVVGTAAGAWFLESETSAGAKSPKLAAFLGADSITYIGNEGYSTLRVYPGNPTALAPSAILGEHCYQDYSYANLPEGYAYFRVVSAAEMQVVRSVTGLCPGSFPQDAAVTYFR